MIEAGVVIDSDHNPIHWHLPPGRSSGALPDSQELWDVLWKNCGNMLGFAHTHPWYGTPHPSSTDLSTFRAVELALGRRLFWWIVTFDQIAYALWDEKLQQYEVRAIGGDNISWLEELRRRSRPPRLRDVKPGSAFRYMQGDNVTQTLPLFVRLEGDRVLNLASGSIFEMMDDDIEFAPPPDVRGPLWR